MGSSVGESCITSSAKDGVTSSIGDVSGVGSTRLVTMKGALWGSGDISIESIPGPGEEEGSGGVLARSVTCQLKPCKSMHNLPRPLRVPNKFEENSDLRGVGSCGLRSLVVLNSDDADAVVPLVDVEVLGQVGSKTRCWRRPS